MRPGLPAQSPSPELLAVPVIRMPNVQLMTNVELMTVNVWIGRENSLQVPGSSGTCRLATSAAASPTRFNL